ncbi:MAG: hypothetical protein RL148_1018 [Planctomycetota bacterium]|jgi:hypothetical protein
MASRSSGGSRPRSRASSSSSSSSSSQTLLLVVGAVAVVGLLLVMSGGGGKKPAVPANQGTSTPAAAPAAAPAPVVSLPAGSAKAGKTPGRPAPALTQETLGKLAQLEAQATVLFNESVTLRNGGDNMKAREAAGRAKDVLEQWNQLVEPNLLWQEEAQLGDWAQPAEYTQLEKLFGAYQTLNNKVRKQGG